MLGRDQIDQQIIFIKKILAHISSYFSKYTDTSRPFISVGDYVLDLVLSKQAEMGNVQEILNEAQRERFFNILKNDDADVVIKDLNNFAKELEPVKPVEKSEILPLPSSAPVTDTIIINKTSRVKGQLTPAAIDALVYCDEHFFSKPYTDDVGTKFPALYLDQVSGLNFYPTDPAKQNFKYVEDTISSDKKEGSKVAYRVNHGLRHAACTTAKCDDLLDFYAANALEVLQNFIKAQTKTLADNERLVSKLQVAMVFYVSGRGGEAGHESPKYKTYRKKSANNFLNYADEKKIVPGIFDSQEEVKLYAHCLENSWVKDEELFALFENNIEKSLVARITLKALFQGMHVADLPRLWNDKRLKEETSPEILRFTPMESFTKNQPKVMEIFADAQQLSDSMGTTSGKVTTRNGWKYQDPMKCYQFDTDVNKTVGHIQQHALQNYFKKIWQAIYKNLSELIEHHPFQFAEIKTVLTEIGVLNQASDILIAIQKIKMALVNLYENVINQHAEQLQLFATENLFAQQIRYFCKQNFYFELPLILAAGNKIDLSSNQNIKIMDEEKYNELVIGNNNNNKFVFKS